MNPPTTRRSFLTKLGALAAAPFAAYGLHKAAATQAITSVVMRNTGDG